MSNDSHGFSLIELLMSLLLAGTILLALLQLTGRVQGLAFDFQERLQRDRTIWTSPLLFSRWLPHAGNERWNQNWSGVEWDGEWLTCRADIDGPQGFPDSELSSAYESLTLRRSGVDLQVRSGQGTFQPFLRGVSEFGVEAYGGTQLTLILKPEETSRDLKKRWGGDQLILHFHLWNYQSNLFPESD